MILSVAQLRDLAARVGFRDPDLMAAIAMAESGGNTNAVNDTRGWTDDQIRAKFALSPDTPVAQEWSIGIFQINALTGGVDPNSLTDATYNAQVAYARSAGGTNLSPWWTTVSRGAYRQYLPAGYAPPTAPATPPPFVGPVTPPARSGGGSTALAALGALALAATAGFVVQQRRAERRREEPPEPEPFVYP